MSDNDEIIQEFISESRDMIDDVEPRLIELKEFSGGAEDIPEELINKIFRNFHSIKGSAGFLEFTQVNRVTHDIETLLDLIRGGKIPVQSTHVDLLCATCDYLFETLDLIEEEGSDNGSESAADKLIAKLQSLITFDYGSLKETAPVERDAAPSADTASRTDGRNARAGGDKPKDLSLVEKQDAKATDKHVLLSLITDEMRERFVIEADDTIGNAEALLLKLEETSDTLPEVIAEALRAVHSFKGNCGFMDYGDLEKVSHSLENILEAIKENRLEYHADVESACLKTIDVLRSGIADISTGGSGAVPAWESLCRQLDTLLPETIGPETAEAESADSRDSKSSRTDNAAKEDSGRDVRQEAPVDDPSLPLDDVKRNDKASKPKRVVRRDIRVDLEKMDLLINLVGELVIAEAMVVNNSDLAGFEFENFERAAGHMNRIIRDLQDVAMSVRMIPVSGTFRKMIRLVHDLSVKAGKKVRLELKGEETEIDKTVAELIADPLVHIIRNAVDHGIDSPDERKRAGKSETGSIRLEARHEGGEIWILIRDDGRGLNRNRILSKAIERGLIKGNGNHLSDIDVHHMIFEPGFSTAERISDVSGRGVGMDVVRKNIEKLKGSIDIHSRPGEGSLFVLRIPLTLAIIEGMLVRVGHAKYTLPILAVKESMRVETDQITTTMDDQVIIKVRDELIPVVRLGDLHDIQPDCTRLEEGIVVILECQGSQVALFVDEVMGQHQAVIKGLSDYVGNVKSVSGCTILGDGDISLILDPGGVLRIAQEAGGRSAPESATMVTEG